MIGNSWDNILKEEYNKEYFKNIITYINKEYSNKTIYPSYEDIFRAFKLTDYNDIKVVILGQDPYHGVKEANGLAFSVHNGIKLPPSLKNIYKELYDDLGIIPSRSGNLEKWAKEGVLLLNSILTVVKDTPASHKEIGWEIFTDEVIKKINNKNTPVVFILWGNYAKSKIKYITNPIHLVITSPHPSPFSAYSGFFGSKPFSMTNNFLKKNNIKEIDWELN